MKKPAQKRQRKKPNASAQSTKHSIDDKKSSSPMPNFNKGNDNYNNAYGTTANNSTNSSSSSSSYFPSVHATSELGAYQSEFKIKQEPLSTIPPRQPYPISHAASPGTYPVAQVKMEGYERNYQNFINYADYCQSQNTTNSAAANSANINQEYGQIYGNYPPYSSAYHHPHHQTYPNSPYNSTGTVPNFSSIPSAETNCNNNHTIPSIDSQDVKPFVRDVDKELNSKSADLTKLTNYEKDIPVHTYPNHGRFTEHNANNSHHTADGIKNVKIDDVSIANWNFVSFNWIL